MSEGKESKPTVKARLYVLKRAVIAISDRNPNTGYLKKIDVANYIQLNEYLKKLRSINVEQEPVQHRLVKQEIQHLRLKIKRKKTVYCNANIKLTDPRYYGYNLDFEICMNDPDERFIEQIKNRIRSTIHTYRNERSQLQESTGKFGKYSVYCYQTKGRKDRVFSVEGQILKIHIKKNMANLFADKKPVSTVTKYVGIELEFCAPIKEENLALILYRAGMHKYVQLKKDGSLRPQEGENGYELAILLPETNYKVEFKKILDVLSSIKAIAVDRRCGVHVHLDMRKRNKDLVFHNLVSCQMVLMKLVDPHRHDNEFCRTVINKKMPINFTGQRQERYKTINAAAYYKYRTLEVRMLEGTLDYGQITGWTDLLIKIANYRRLLKRSINKLTILKKRFNLSKRMYQYVIDRSCYWQINQQTNGDSSRPYTREYTSTATRVARPMAQPSNPVPDGAVVADEMGALFNYGSLQSSRQGA